VPVEPPIFAQAEIFHQAGRILGAGPIGIVGRNGVGDLVEVGETVGIGLHETADVVNALRRGIDHDVDEHHGVGNAGFATAAHHIEGDHAAHRCADQGNRAIDGFDDGTQIRAARFDAVIGSG
jgi:hypothetical protein